MKIVEKREVVIAGHVERQEGNTRSVKRFCKRFILPEDILEESVTSVMSSDGVLTVVAPRKVKVFAKSNMMCIAKFQEAVIVK